MRKLLPVRRARLFGYQVQHLIEPVIHKMPQIFKTLSIDDEELKVNFRKLNDSFVEKYGGLQPDFFVRVPGRVNLIGEHIDYNGYNVCPMAIKQSILGAVKAVDNSLNVTMSNVESQKYVDYSCKLDSIVIKTEPNKAPAWYQYVLCGLKGILETSRVQPSKGIILHIFGTIPPASGLSSSSALVCAAALSLSVVLNINFSNTELAEITAKAERHIGTEGGGMDQAIIFNARKGTASRISFDPLKLTEVNIPQKGVFVIAQSMVTKNKAASSDFNARVVECRLASLIIAKKQGLKNWQKYKKLADVQKGLDFDLGKMLQLVTDTFPNNYYSKDEVCQILDISESQLEDEFLTKNTKFIDEFKLRDRALHVFGEALRVEMFCKICETTKSLAELGRLMFESHTSLKNYYECSHTALDRLVAVCSMNGALGARLTGAGWGGCIVALVAADSVGEFVKSVKASYAGQVPATVDVANLIFVTKPGVGASVFNPLILEDNRMMESALGTNL